jgi:hypothetical protein
MSLDDDDDIDGMLANLDDSNVDEIATTLLPTAEPDDAKALPAPVAPARRSAGTQVRVARSRPPQPTHTPARALPQPAAAIRTPARMSFRGTPSTPTTTALDLADSSSPSRLAAVSRAPSQTPAPPVRGGSVKLPARVGSPADSASRTPAAAPMRSPAREPPARRAALPNSAGRADIELPSSPDVTPAAPPAAARAPLPSGSRRGVPARGAAAARMTPVATRAAPQTTATRGNAARRQEAPIEDDFDFGDMPNRNIDDEDLEAELARAEAEIAAAEAIEREAAEKRAAAEKRKRDAEELVRRRQQAASGAANANAKSVEDDSVKKAAADAAERKAKEEADRKAKEEADRRAKEEAERKAKAEAQRKAKEAKEETDRKWKEESERKAKEAEAKKAELEKRRAEQQKRAAAEAKRIEAESALSAVAALLDEDAAPPAVEVEEEEYEMVPDVPHYDPNDKRARAKALNKYVGQGPGELNFEKGDTVIIVQQEDDGWWLGVNRKGETGWFEYFYVELWPDWPPMRKRLKPKSSKTTGTVRKAAPGSAAAATRPGAAPAGNRAQPAVAGRAAARPQQQQQQPRALPNTKQVQPVRAAAAPAKDPFSELDEMFGDAPSGDVDEVPANDVVDAIDEAIAAKASATRLDTLRKPKAGGGTGARRPPTRRKKVDIEVKEDTSAFEEAAAAVPTPAVIDMTAAIKEQPIMGFGMMMPMPGMGAKPASQPARAEKRRSWDGSKGRLPDAPVKQQSQQARRLPEPTRDDLGVGKLSQSARRPLPEVQQPQQQQQQQQRSLQQPARAGGVSQQRRALPSTGAAASASTMRNYSTKMPSTDKPDF